MPSTTLQLYSRQRCERRTRLATRKGFEAAPIRLYGSAPPGALEKATPISAKGSVPTGEAALARINAVLGKTGDDVLTADQIHLHYCEAGNTNYVQQRLMFLAPSTLKNITKAADAGFALMNSHRTGGLSSDAEFPLGRTFAGRYENWALEGGQTHGRALLGVYMLKGVHPNGASGPSTDDISAGINGGTVFDVSLGLTGPYRALCDVCGKDLRASDPETGKYLCPHVPGTTREMTTEQKQTQRDRGVPDGVATYSIDGASAGEVSAVFDGAVPGAGFRKALAATRAGTLSRSELLQLQSSYGRLFGGASRQTFNLARPALNTTKGKLMPRVSLAGLWDRLRTNEIDPEQIEVDLDDDVEEGGQFTAGTLKLTAAPPPPPAPDPEVVQLRKELAEERTRREAEKREARLAAIATEVDTFVAGEKLAGRVNGEQLKALAPSLRQAAVDDLDHPVENFSRLATAKAVQLAARPHGKTEEVVAGGKKPEKLTTLPNDGEDGYDPVKLAREQNDRVLGAMGIKPTC